MGVSNQDGDGILNNQKLWYKQPAERWEDALPIGTGRLGAMIYGYPDHELMQLNEDSIWYGGPINRINPRCRKHMKEVQNLILDGHISEAEEILKYNFCATPRSMRVYQPLGWLHIDMRTEGVFFLIGLKQIRIVKLLDFPRKEEAPVSECTRALLLEQAIHQSVICTNGIRYQRESFASYPAQVIAVNLTSEKKGKLSFSCLLERGRFLEWSGKTGENTVMIRGSQGEGGVRYCGAISVTAAGGNVRVAGEHILVNNAGVSESTPFTSYTEADFDRVIDLNVKGVFNATRAVVDGMIKNHSGVVLNTSSMVSISGQPSGFAYPASKFAVNGTTISLARELGPKGIRVNAVAPGITETD